MKKNKLQPGTMVTMGKNGFVPATTSSKNIVGITASTVIMDENTETKRIKHILKCSKCKKRIATYYMPYYGGTTYTSVDYANDPTTITNNETVIIDEEAICKTCHQIEKLRE